MELEASSRQPHPLIIILVTLLAVFFGFQIVGPIIGFILSIPFYPGNMMELAEAIVNPVNNPELKLPLFIMQGFGTLTGLIIVPLILLKIFHQPFENLFQGSLFPQPILLTIAIVFTFMAVNSVFIEWNQKLDLPDFLSGFEEWAKSTEEKLEQLTTFLTKFDSISELIIALVVIAILPAIGEELVFRGIIQRELYKGTGNIHVSIWVAATIFSAIHLQFFGFIPRLFLGALFGYLYYWSGNLSLAMLAHFVNNGLMVVAMYFYQKEMLDIDIESTESAPWSAVAFSAVITTILLYLFKTFYDKRSAPSSGNVQL